MLDELTLTLPSNFETALEASILQDDFYEFVVSAWPIVETDVKFVPNWHIVLVCHYLQALYEGRIPSNNLIINMPPRHMKSLLVNVFFPAWVWTKRPSLKFLCFSATEKLTVRDSMKCRGLIGSSWYQDRFPLGIDERNDQKAQFNNTKGGYRYCFGIEGSIAGQGGDFLLIDDPQEIGSSNSSAERERVNYVYDNSISSRGNDPQTVKKVIIMQRLHEDDLCGHVLEKDEQWERLILPAEYDGERFVSSIGLKDHRTELGELLWPDRFGEKEIKISKSNLGEMGIAGQLQQRPAPLKGNIFKKNWFKDRFEIRDIIAVYISSDTASSVGENSARSSILVGGLTADYRLVPLLIRADKWEFPELLDEIVKTCEPFREKLFELVIENKSSGQQAIQTLRKSAPDWLRDKVTAFNPPAKLEKPERASVASKWCENGSVLLPTTQYGGEWLFAFEDELFNFPNGKYADMTDSFVQLILFLENFLSQGYHVRLGV